MSMLRPIIVATCLSAVAACSASSDDRPTTDGARADASTTAVVPPTSAAVVPTSAPDVPTTAPATIATVDGQVVDESRDRRIPYRAYVPSTGEGPFPLILVSHGGDGNASGHLSGSFLGSTLAERGFIAVHVGHRSSSGGRRHVDDRPADVSYLLDRIEDGTIGFGDADADLTRVGHTGHSFGAYTAHALAGATYLTTHTDERITAIAALSPQGPDQFGAFDRGPEDNTWMTVDIPVYALIGSDEIDSNAVDSIERPGWRLVPFQRYPGTADTFQTVIAGQDHSDLWRTGSPEVEAFLADAVADFFAVYVAGDGSVDPCTIGSADADLATTERRAGTVESRITDC